MKKLHIYLFLALIFAFKSAEAQRLSRTEKKIVEKVKAMDEAAIDFLVKVVNINSGQ